MSREDTHNMRVCCCSLLSYLDVVVLMSHKHKILVDPHYVGVQQDSKTVEGKHVSYMSV